MSRKIAIDSLTEEELESFSNELQIIQEPSKYAFNTHPNCICLYEVNNNNIYIPFAYSRKYSRSERTPEKNVQFTGELRTGQKEVRKEAIERLNSHGSVIIATYPGWGKCLQKNTPILMFDGTTKMVQDITVGEKIMGDDSNPRNILSICSGQEQMYKIVPVTGDSFGVNKSHILSLKIDTEIFDISIHEYLKLKPSIKYRLKLYKVPITFPETIVDIDPYLFGSKLTDRIPKKYLHNSRDIQLKLLAGIIDSVGYLHENCYKIDHKNKALTNDIIFLCRSLGFGVLSNKNIIEIYGRGLEEIPVLVKALKQTEDPLVTNFEIVPITDDSTYYGFTIDGNHRFLLGDFTVTHNTITAINIASKIKMKTLILCHRIVLINQWKDAIIKFCPEATVQVLTASSKMQDNDFYIMNAVNVQKHNRDFYKEMGFLIVDECIPGKVPILLENGTKNIEDIHKDFQKGKIEIVQSYNEKTKSFEAKKVINTWQREIIGKTLLEISFCGKSRKIKCTDNHKILTSTGYKPAKDIIYGELVVSYTNHNSHGDISNVPNSDQWQIILGSFLGDGHIQTLPSGRYRLSIIHGEKQREYCQWKASILGIDKVRYTGSAKNPAYSFSTKIFDSSNLFPKIKTDCPDWIIKQLDLRGIAIWYMDDGNFSKFGNSIKFHTESFSVQTVEKFVQKFAEYGINSYISIEKGKYPVIYIGNSGVKKLLTLLDPYLHVSKWLEDYNRDKYNRLEYVPLYELSEGDIISLPLKRYEWSCKYENYGYLRVKTVKITDFGKEKYVYDLEVEDNHNFILASSSGKNGPIVHNCHLIMADKLSYCMKYILPRYVLGLSATPYRTDGLDILLDMYFGKYKIIRKLYRKHIIYRYNTGFKPEVKLNRMGKVDWSSVLESQCTNNNRNEVIIRIIQYFSDRIFLVLCKRVEQANYIVNRLHEEKEDVTSLIGSNQEFEQSSRILVGTVQKTGIGFDHPRLNTLILASDVEQYFVQYLGRVFRREDTEPVIFDLVDNFTLLLRHFKTRNSVYIEHGGIVKDFQKEFPTFV